MSPRFLCLGTHHKTGTVWMRRTFRKYADAVGVPTVRMTRNATSKESLPETGPALCVNWDSRFPTDFFEDPRARFLHIIRDPRDVLISGHRYHIRRNHANEGWLHKPRAELGNISYRQHIASLPDRVSQLLFEMEGKHASTLKNMLAWPYGHSHVVDLRYEDLIYDYDCSQFRAAIENMNVSGFNIEGVVLSFWTHSLFGGNAEQANRTHGVNSHIASGATEQWRTKLPIEVAEIYAETYGNALIELGYAKNSGWVAECLPNADIEDSA